MDLRRARDQRRSTKISSVEGLCRWAGRAAGIRVVDPRHGAMMVDAVAAVLGPWPAWITVDGPTRRFDQQHIVPAGLRGADLLRALGSDPGADRLIVDGEDGAGILRRPELAMLSEPFGLALRRTIR